VTADTGPAPDPQGPSSRDLDAAHDLDAQAVLGRELRQAFRGYHMDDVDTLLGLVADAIAERDATIAELTARLEGGGVAPSLPDGGSDGMSDAAAGATSPASPPAAADGGADRAAHASDAPAATVARRSVWPRWRGGAAAGAAAGDADATSDADVPGAEVVPAVVTSDGAADDALDDMSATDVVLVLAATRARRRALTPSAILVVLAAAALVHGAITGMRETLVAAAIVSGLALVGVAVALVLTRGRATDDEDDDFDWS
jgi:DivIVA domain-containing protein